jgi:hypothetical protein
VGQDQVVWRYLCAHSHAFGLGTAHQIDAAGSAQVSNVNMCNSLLGQGKVPRYGGFFG